jgi:hypothetical protein
MRTCECGARLSQYNPEDRCQPCRERTVIAEAMVVPSDASDIIYGWCICGNQFMTTDRLGRVTRKYCSEACRKLKYDRKPDVCDKRHARSQTDEYKARNKARGWGNAARNRRHQWGEHSRWR